ncbi:MAG TPA: type II toxin-antitoxin system VapC family toxin [Desulfatiglandales bacterium]|nr:type II toxin-antitoxin system VapC family toxin [Desulfatiglandales bacterium]
MKYLLDTNICIYIINEKSEKVLRKFEQYPVYEFGISSITHAELQYGIEKSKNKNTNQDALDEFLLPLTILPFHGKKLVTCYGEIRASLESKGKTIGPFDMLIAAHALSLDLTIISNNIKEFSRIPNLKCENWILEL